MDADYLRDLFAVFGPVTVKRMFGGSAILAEGVSIALEIRDVIYLKVDAGNAAAFEAEGLAPFSYQRKGKPAVATSYRRMPERLYDDPDELADWARASLAAAQRVAASKRTGAAKRPGSRKGASRIRAPAKR